MGLEAITKLLLLILEDGITNSDVVVHTLAHALLFEIVE